MLTQRSGDWRMEETPPQTTPLTLILVFWPQQSSTNQLTQLLFLVAMLVDNTFNFQQPAFEDFFNMDLLAGPSTGNASSSGSSSRSSSHSPSSAFAALPPTPPNPYTVPDVQANDFFNFLDDDFTKTNPLAPPPTVAAPFDFLGSFDPSFSYGSAMQSSSPDSGVGSSGAMSDFDEEEEHENAHELETILESPLEDDSITPVKVGGKGKSARKGTVQSGGVVKKSGGTALKDKMENQPAMLSTTSMEPDDWRPTPEEYKKMSSKEKRQLRNKISARNFRVRRKEYINTLEGDIAERDRLIDHIRTELLGTKSENSALRQEIAALKKALLDGRGRSDTPVLPPPAPLPAVSAAMQAQKTPKGPLLTPNTHKDLPTSPRLGARSFWGGAASGLGGFGGITPVHTTLIPEWSSVLSGKPVSGGNAERRPSLQENINPTLNGFTASTVAGFGMGVTPQKNNNQQEKMQLPLNNNFDAFADKNLFTLKSMEDFRMQLWTRMGQQQALLRQQQQAQQAKEQPSPLNGLASGMRPHYFAKTSPTLSALLSGKSAASAYPTPPASPRMSHTPASTPTPQPQATPTEQQAMLAAVASQTLVRKLGSAFWDAFSGSSSSSGPSIRKDWDAEKVRKVLEGKAVVRVVDVDPQPQQPSPKPAPVSERSSPSASPKMLPVADKKNCGGACFTGVTNLLEEGIRNMHL
ncbi:unnamed protein product [Somion occarium]|uniref:BZIP domain-containing protein n=1 Tax=Somion occarium TaxID=3059160 RepID=A0ABP1DPG5_9APHY